MAGAGLKQGTTFGQTDDFGYNAVEDRVHWHDFHATVLHLLGIDHERLTYYHNGIRRRLTNVHGERIKGILACYACPVGVSDCRGGKLAACRRTPASWKLAATGPDSFSGFVSEN